VLRIISSFYREARLGDIQRTLQNVKMAPLSGVIREYLRVRMVELERKSRLMRHN
jgi:hypothetical protein